MTGPRKLPMFLALIGLIGCQDSIIAPHQASPSLQSGVIQRGTHACPLPADIIVDNETELLTALGSAGAGDVIGIDGMIPLTNELYISTPGITLTCATAGSGFSVAGVYDWMFNVAAANVTVDRLVIDGRNSGTNTLTAYAPGVVISRNTVLPGPGIGIYLISGWDHATVIDNHVIATIPAVSGIHIQSGGGGLVLTGNTSEALVPNTSVRYGGIRVIQTVGAVINDNTVMGPWFNSFSLTRMQDSEIRGNYATGAVNFGLLFSQNPGDPSTGMRNNVFRNNRFTNVGTAESEPPLGFPPAGMLVVDACYNTFFGNNLNGNFNDVGAVFAWDTGDNTMIGNTNVIFDDGDRDCDGDGVTDPNHFSGSGNLFAGGFGPIISEAASGTGGIK